MYIESARRKKVVVDGVLARRLELELRSLYILAVLGNARVFG